MAPPSSVFGEGLLPAPPGVTPNFVDPVTNTGHLIVASIVLPILAAIFVAARCASKALSGSWGWDDYLAFIGFALNIAESVISIESAKNGNGRHVWDVPVTMLAPYLKYTYAETIVYSISLYCIKMSLLVLLYRVFGVNKHFRWAWCVVAGIWTLYEICGIAVCIFQCIPVHKAWDETAKGHCIDLVKLGIASGLINAATDVMILILPIPMVWSLHLPTNIRLAITAIFATGLLVIATTLVREAEVIMTIHKADFTWYTANSLLWLVIELNISLMCCCMPTLKPLLRRISGSESKKSRPSYKYKSQSTPNVSNPLKSNGSTLMDASYIELGPPGTNRDVRIAAENSHAGPPWNDHGNGGIIKTDTFGQAVHYKGREDYV